MYNPEPGSTSKSACESCPKDEDGNTKSPEGSSEWQPALALEKFYNAILTLQSDQLIMCVHYALGFYGTGDGDGCVSRSIVVIVLKKLLLMEFEIFINWPDLTPTFSYNVYSCHVPDETADLSIWILSAKQRLSRWLPPLSQIWCTVRLEPRCFCNSPHDRISA